jgi:hypothetical protein
MDRQISTAIPLTGFDPRAPRMRFPPSAFPAPAVRARRAGVQRESRQGWGGSAESGVTSSRTADPKRDIQSL